jgi:FkbM family methyltransferase
MGRYRTWGVSLFHPRERLLPGLGNRLGRHPRLASRVLMMLRLIPTRRLRALAYRHVAVPLVSRMDTKLIVRAVGGVRLIADPPDPSGRLLATAGLWEWHVGEVIRRSLGRGDVFVDVGANAGYYTALAAELVGETGHIYALEPAPSTFQKLERTLSLNSLENVTALAVAAGAAEGTAVLCGPPSGHDASSSLRNRPSDGVTTSVRVRPLCDVVPPWHQKRLSLVKVDVEGYEDDVLYGLEPLLSNGVRSAVVVEVHATDNPAAPSYVVGFCARHGLRAYWLVEDEGFDEHLAPADRRLVLEDLGEPPDLSSIPRARYAVLLTPRPWSVTSSQPHQRDVVLERRVPRTMSSELGPNEPPSAQRAAVPVDHVPYF